MSFRGYHRIPPAVAGLLAVGVAVVLYWVKFDGNITGFFRFGDRFSPSPLIEQEVRIVPGGQGYDGQFFLAIALDPLLGHEGSIAALDYPRYRYRRILYPLLGHVLGLGRATLIPYALVVVNVACIPLLLGIGTLLLGGASESRRGFLGLLVLAPLGVWVSLSLSTCDLLGSTLFLAALLSAAKGRAPLSALLIACAALTRETYLAVALMLSVVPLMRKENRRVNWHYLPAMAPAALWLAYGAWRIPSGSDRVGEHFGVPFGGILTKLSDASAVGGVAHGFDLFSFALLICAAILGTCLLGAYSVRLLRRSVGIEGQPFPATAVLLCALPHIAILVLGTNRMFSYYAHHTRIFMDLFLLVFLAGEATRLRWLTRGLMVVSALASAAFVVHYACG